MFVCITLGSTGQGNLFVISFERRECCYRFSHRELCKVYARKTFRGFSQETLPGAIYNIPILIWGFESF